MRQVYYWSGNPFERFSYGWAASTDASRLFTKTDFNFRTCDNTSTQFVWHPMKLVPRIEYILDEPPGANWTSMEIDLLTRSDWAKAGMDIPNAQVIVRVTRVDAKFKKDGNVTIATCDSSRLPAHAAWHAPATVPKVDDTVVFPGQCVAITARLYGAVPCRDTNVVFETSLLADFCQRTPSASECQVAYDKHATSPHGDRELINATTTEPSAAETIVEPTPKLPSSMADKTSRRVGWLTTTAMGMTLVVIAMACVSR